MFRFNLFEFEVKVNDIVELLKENWQIDYIFLLVGGIQFQKGVLLLWVEPYFGKNIRGVLLRQTHSFENFFPLRNLQVAC